MGCCWQWRIVHVTMKHIKPDEIDSSILYLLMSRDALVNLLVNMVSMDDNLKQTMTMTIRPVNYVNNGFSRFVYFLGKLVGSFSGRGLRCVPVVLGRRTFKQTSTSEVSDCFQNLLGLKGQGMTSHRSWSSGPVDSVRGSSDFPRWNSEFRLQTSGGCGCQKFRRPSGAGRQH